MPFWPLRRRRRGAVRICQRSAGALSKFGDPRLCQRGSGLHLARLKITARPSGGISRRSDVWRTVMLAAGWGLVWVPTSRGVVCLLVGVRLIRRTGSSVACYVKVRADDADLPDQQIQPGHNFTCASLGMSGPVKGASPAGRACRDCSCRPSVRRSPPGRCRCGAGLWQLTLGRPIQPARPPEPAGGRDAATEPSYFSRPDRLLPSAVPRGCPAYPCRSPPNEARPTGGTGGTICPARRFRHSCRFPWSWSGDYHNLG